MVKNNQKRYDDGNAFERWRDMLLNIGFEEIKEFQLDTDKKIYSERTLDTKEVKLPDWLGEYYYLVTKVVIPEGVTVIPILGYYRGYYLLIKATDTRDFPQFGGSKIFLKQFDPFMEFDGVMTGKVTTHHTEHKGVKTERARIAFTGKEIAEIGLDIGHQFNILFKKKKGGHPGFLVFQYEDD